MRLRRLPLLMALAVWVAVSAAAEQTDWDALVAIRPAATSSGAGEASGPWEGPLRVRRAAQTLDTARLTRREVADWLGSAVATGSWVDGRLGLFREEDGAEQVVIEVLFEDGGEAGSFVDAADLRLRRGAGRADRWTVLQRGSFVRIVIALATGDPPEPLPPDRWEDVEFSGENR